MDAPLCHDRDRGIPGVQVVTPQLFLSTMRGASCCSVSDMFMIAYDPETDFTVHPWLEQNMGRELGLGEAIGGTYVTVPEGRDNILIYGYEIELAGNLEPTGSGLDQSMFFTFETALEIARLSPMQAESELVIAPDSISAALVRLDEDADPHQVALQIEAAIPGVTAIESGNLFRAQRERVLGLIRSAAALSLIAWVMCIVLIGLVTSLAITQRKREIGVLRALGVSRNRVLAIAPDRRRAALPAGRHRGKLPGGFCHVPVPGSDRPANCRCPFYIPTPLSLLLLALGILAFT